MTDNDIKKSIEWHLNSETNCDECSYKDFKETNGNCVGKMLKDALDLINSKDEIIKAQADNIFLLESALKDKTAEIERLQKFKTYFDSLYGINLEVEGWHENGNTISFDEFYDSAIEDMDSAEHHISYIIKCVKSEAIKEFAERLTDKADLVKANAFDSRWAIWQDDIDNLVKEMTEENENGKV